jgi:hypothetical protein
MAKILLVHGMNMQNREREPLHRLWSDALLRLLRRTAWGKANEARLPKASEIEIAYWADLFKWPKFEDQDAAAKGLTSWSRDRYFDLCRSSVRLADTLASFGPNGRPTNASAAYLDGLVAQTAIYMHNGPVYHPDPAVGDGAFFQVQARFVPLLESGPNLVIGHSLGSVVAYEGLYRNQRRKLPFITIGSPLASPYLILEPLRQRVAQHSKGPEREKLPWPGVSRWTNFYAGADVWCVPVEGLSHLIPDVRDVRVEHGSTLDPKKTHQLTSYLEHIEIGNAIAEALAEAQE